MDITRERADQLRAAASRMIDRAEQLEAEHRQPVIYEIPEDPALSTICEGCQ